MGTWDGDLNVWGCLQEGSHSLDKGSLEVHSEEEMGKELFGDSLFEEQLWVLALGCPPRTSPLWNPCIQGYMDGWIGGWLFDPQLVGHVLWAFLLAFPTGHLASPLGAQAARPRALKAELFLYNPKPALLLRYSCVNDATRCATPEPSLTSPLNPPHALSCKASLVLLQDALSYLSSLLFPSWFRPLWILKESIIIFS